MSLPTCKANRAAVTYDLRLSELDAIALFDVLGRVAGPYDGPRGRLQEVRQALRVAMVPDINQRVAERRDCVEYTQFHTRTSSCPA